MVSLSRPIAVGFSIQHPIAKVVAGCKVKDKMSSLLAILISMDFCIEMVLQKCSNILCINKMLLQQYKYYIWCENLAFSHATISHTH